MSKKVSPVPRGYRTATPCLTVFDVDSAIAFYQAAFGAEMLTRQTADDEFNAVQATIKIGNSIIIVNREAPEQGLFAPVSLGGAGGSIHLYVDDVNTSWERAIEAGALVAVPMYDAYWGDRGGVLIDGNGHAWSLASRIENVGKDELARRAKMTRQAELEAPAVDATPVDLAANDAALAADPLAV